MRKTNAAPVTTEKPTWISLDEAAKIMEMSHNRTHNEIISGRLKGKVGYFYSGNVTKYLYCQEDLQVARAEDRDAQSLPYSQCAA